MSPEPSLPAEPTLSLVEDDPALRLQRVLGLVPRAGLGVGRRALLLAAVAWLPIAIWAVVAGRAWAAAAGEPLLQHFGVQVRALIAIPFLVLAEGTAHGVTTLLVPYFLTSGIVPPAERARFVDVLEGVRGLRNATLPWILIVGLVVAWTIAPVPASHLHEISWATDAAPGGPGHGFGGWWFLWVTRALYVALLLAWLWRLVLLLLLLRRIARLPLAIVPTHPDRLGGLGFLERLPVAFAPVIFALAAVIASRWAHDVVYHGVHVGDLKLPAATFLVLVLLVFLAPLVVFTGPLARGKRQALLDYGALVGEHGRLVRRRWILGEPVDTELLAAPEIGPVADTLAIYDAVTAMRTSLIGKRTIAMVLVPAVIPLVLVAAIEVPVKEMLFTVLKAIV